MCLGSCFRQRTFPDFFKAHENTESHDIGVIEDFLSWFYWKLSYIYKISLSFAYMDSVLNNSLE